MASQHYVPSLIRHLALVYGLVFAAFMIYFKSHFQNVSVSSFMVVLSFMGKEKVYLLQLLFASRMGICYLAGWSGSVGQLLCYLRYSRDCLVTLALIRGLGAYTGAILICRFSF